jgi:hypothetical protein
MDRHPPHGGGQPPSLEDSNTTPAAWAFDAAFTFSAFGLAQNPFSVGDGEMTTVIAPTMNPQFMNYQFNQVTYGNGNPPMTAASEPATTFFTQNNVPSAAQSPLTTSRRAFGSTPSVLQYAMNPPPVAPPATQEPRVSLTTNKTPPSNVQFGKRKYIGLKTYQNGEPSIQRRIIRYALLLTLPSWADTLQIRPRDLPTTPSGKDIHGKRPPRHCSSTNTSALARRVASRGSKVEGHRGEFAALVG